MDSFVPLNLSSLVFGVAASFGAYTVALWTYRLWFGPLKDLPGPWYTKVSDLWILMNALALRQCHEIDRLFNKYGPIVCLGPNKVGFLDPAATKVVYSRFPKDAYYKYLKQSGMDSTFTILNPLEHAARRRSFAGFYNLDNLVRFYPDIDDYALRLVTGLDRIDTSKAVDCLVMFRHLMTDVLMLVAYDLRTDNLGKWAAGELDPIAVAINDWPKRSMLMRFLLPPVPQILQRFGGARVRQFLNAENVIWALAGKSLAAARKTIAAGLDDGEHAALTTRLVKYKFPDGKSFSDVDIKIELALNTVAGIDTTSTTLSYILWALATHPTSMSTLQAELDETMDDPHRIPAMSVLAKLPYLNAVLHEGLRLYGAVPAALPRTVPASNIPLVIHGYKIPARTTVLTQAWSTHRQESIFHKPETWLPERWLNETEEMKSAFMPFGAGSRSCAGMNLAWANMRVTIAALLRNFDLVVPPQTTHRSMHILEALVIFPISQQCEIVFVPRNK